MFSNIRITKKMFLKCLKVGCLKFSVNIQNVFCLHNLKGTYYAPFYKM